MAACLSFRTNPFLSSVIPLGAPGKGNSAIDELRKKIQGFKLRMDDVKQKLDVISNEQKDMHQTAVLIERDQGEMKAVLKPVEKRQKKFDHTKKIIQKDHLLIRASIQAISLMWGQLTKMAEGLQKDQVEIAFKFKKIEQKKVACLKQAVAIQNNEMIIRENLLEAAQKIDKIQQNGASIQQNLEVIELQEMQIENEKLQILQQVRNLEVLQSKGRLLANLQTVEIMPQQAEALNLCSSLLSRIIDYSLRALAAIRTILIECQANLKNRQYSLQGSTGSAVLNNPLTWVLLGIVACAAIKSSALSFICIGKAALLFYDQRTNVLRKIVA